MLQKLDFGKVDSESETDLDRRFVRTVDFDDFLQDHVWLALGAKGTGKSALFELFTKFEPTARQLAGSKLNGVRIGAGTGFGDLSEVATGDIQTLRDGQASFDHDKLWRLYIAVKAGLSLDPSWSIPRGPLKDLLSALGERRDFRVGPLLKELWELAVGNAPDQVTVSAQGATVEIRGGRRSLDVVTLLEDVNSALTSAGNKLWLLFDKIDEIWPADRAERQRALEGLLTASMSIRRTFPAIQPKILLRSDLWAELDFTNKDHLTDKKIELAWSSDQIATLLLKRAMSTQEVRDYCEQRVSALYGKTVEDVGPADREAGLLTIFPPTAYPGQNEARSMDWLVARVTDGRKTVLPRDAIVLASAARKIQLEQGEADLETLISRTSLREAFTTTSVTKFEAYLAEFPDLREHFRRFSGQTTAEFSRTELIQLMDGLTPNSDEMLERFFEIGLLTPNTGRVLTASSFEVPRLFRSGLGLVIRGRL
ncbi:hypothetical protein FJ656_23650 [Schumannella luteola]|uniref:Uncharacterized protein n=1 Tax=Schumannella luteola TaxID=472059 RepID=A0A852YF90_9MICO|nr:hypothetical protein [Schumannella luteola]NYG99821.1 hypothetical protein [Schumannella luteola]TPX02243.1 hypothetical protein FJ656_23650 [Schumannella luteola]